MTTADFIATRTDSLQLTDGLEGPFQPIPFQVSMTGDL